ncbi:lipopolysaccharide biosynthesis protein [Citrobacter sedlakii]|uniref:lipopolysaccharide biosynthesis protein n=1 Tax=Citrobacter TaxID=544 RepID=UPI0018FFF653|nr:lipopolysaccharide biosynthesis protein [Citrobacter sedlakii]MBJ9889179.1 lipopolysaccharide biosynthesis protein [Citrobacter sedlakii]MCK8143507.1 lipopolysaccharide biosynthesis protein [Citrobacter sedlakii]
MKIYFINWKADYETHMISYLHKHYPVTNIDVPSRYVWWGKKLTKIGIQPDWLGKKFIHKSIADLKPTDVAVFNDSVINKGLTPYIIKNLNCRKVLLLRNTVSITFLMEWSHTFDIIYDFENRGHFNDKLKYIGQFFPVGLKEIDKYVLANKKTKKPVCFFLGRDKKRLPEILKLADKLASFNLQLDFNVVKDYETNDDSGFLIDEPLSYKENLAHALASDIIVDITQQNQSGWTLRVLEALYFNKKIITNNLSVLDSEVFSRDRFFVPGYHSWDDFEWFLQSSIAPLSPEVLYSYSPDRMIEKVIEDFQVL